MGHQYKDNTSMHVSLYKRCWGHLWKYLYDGHTNTTTHIITFNIDKSREEWKISPLINIKTLPTPVNISYKITPEVGEESDSKIGHVKSLLENLIKEKKSVLTHDWRPVC